MDGEPSVMPLCGAIGADAGVINETSYDILLAAFAGHRINDAGQWTPR